MTLRNDQQHMFLYTFFPKQLGPDEIIEYFRPQIRILRKMIPIHSISEVCGMRLGQKNEDVYEHRV